MRRAVAPGSMRGARGAGRARGAPGTHACIACAHSCVALRAFWPLQAAAPAWISGRLYRRQFNRADRAGGQATATSLKSRKGVLRRHVLGRGRELGPHPLTLIYTLQGATAIDIYPFLLAPPQRRATHLFGRPFLLASPPQAGW